MDGEAVFSCVFIGREEEAVCFFQRQGGEVNELGIFIMLFENHMKIIGVDITGQSAGQLEEVGVEADGDFHAFEEVVHHRGKEGRFTEVAHFHDFRKVLMVLGKAVLPGRFEVGSFFFIVLGNHFLSAAAVAGEGEAVEGVVDGKDACMDQGVEDGNNAAGMAAWNGYFLRFGNGFFLVFGKFRESVYPVVVGTVGSGCVKDADRDILHSLYHFFRGSVGKAEEHEICFFCEGLNGGDIFSFIFRQMEEFYIFSFGHSVLKTEARGSRFTYHGTDQKKRNQFLFHNSSSFQSMGYSPKVATMTALMVGSRLAASWKAREKGASNTSSVTSMPFRPKRS